jgi:hypothetical protein
MTVYSAFGMVKLSRTNFGFLAFSCFSTFGFAGTRILDDAVTHAFVDGFNTGFAADLVTDFATGLAMVFTGVFAGVFMATLTAALVVAVALAGALLARAANFFAGTLALTFLAGAIFKGAAGLRLDASLGTAFTGLLSRVIMFFLFYLNGVYSLYGLIASRQVLALK